MIYTPAKLHEQIDHCLLVDQYRLRRRLGRVSRDNESLVDSLPELKKLLSNIETSKASRVARYDAVPQPQYPDALPVVAKRDEIIAAIKKHSVVIVCGETGSGKTTQLPKMCLEAGRGVAGIVGHTQPRRIAARSVAARIASELNDEVGGAVGFRIRFSDRVGERTYIKLMTDGILLAEIQHDPWLNQYDTIIIDEAHERSLNIDFLLGYLKQLLRKRRDLKIIITSATIDPERFSRHFDNAPIIVAEGRSYPVEVRWQPLENDLTEEDIDLPQAIVNACDELLSERCSDILVFMSGERDIRELNDVLSKQASHAKAFRGVEILPLFSRLSNAEQNRIFQKHSLPRIILATNVAETSLTVPGIRAVIDTGVARVSRYSVRSKVQRLPIEKISQASANQRKGRCGREAPGVCIRLYSEDDFTTRDEFTQPEILRTNLAAVILQMASMRLGQIEEFPFLEPPEQKFINDGYRTLQEIAALNEKRKLTSIGKRLSRLPVDPRLGRILLAAQDLGCVSEALTIVSALSVQDPRDRPFEKRQAADELHAEFNHEKSDFMAWLNLWSFLIVEKKQLSQSQFRKMCKQRFVSYMRVREWMEVRHQLAEQCKAMKILLNTEEASYDNIHQSLLSGLLSNVAVRTEQHDYLGTRNRHLQIFPGSSLRKKGPKWLVAAEVSETSRLYARTVASVSVEWIERLGEHLLQYHYRDPHWQRKAGVVGAFEQSTLFGLIVNPKKRVNFSAQNPVLAREIFIRDALVEGQIVSKGKFLPHNMQLMEEVAGLEDKSRRRDIAVDPEELVRFYDALLPEEINSTVSFETWRRKIEQESPRALFFTRDMLVREDAEEVSENRFPLQIEMSDMVLPLKYHFSPGDDDDGVTMVVPVEVLNRVCASRCEWLVPGMLQEKITYLIKSMPKVLRRNFVPAPDYAETCCQVLQRLGGLDIRTTDFSLEAIAPHLLMRFEVLDNTGKVINSGRDLQILQKQYASHVEENLLQFSDSTIERDNITDWNFGDLPESVDISKGGIQMRGYPALTTNADKVSIKLFASADQASHAMRNGLMGLYKCVLKEEMRYLQRKLPNIELLSLRFAPFGGKKVLIADISDEAIYATFIAGTPTPRKREDFQQQLSQQRSNLIPNATRICADIEQVLEAHRQVAKRVSGNLPLSWIEPVADIRDQIDQLLYPGFITHTGMGRLRRLVVYFQAINRRLDSIDHAPDKDRRRRAELLPVWERFKSLPQKRDDPVRYNELYGAVRWAFEELRVSLFAQELGTTEKVSVSKLENRVDELIALL